MSRKTDPNLAVVTHTKTTGVVSTRVGVFHDGAGDDIVHFQPISCQSRCDATSHDDRVLEALVVGCAVLTRSVPQSIKGMALQGVDDPVGKRRSPDVVD